MEYARTAAMFTLLGTLAVACATPAVEQPSGSSRQEEVARKGSTVMPFDLARTTHYFDDTSHGGTETVKANDPADARQAALVRYHLATEAERFRRGDFSDPAAIHGEHMAGLAVLRRSAGKLRVDYREVPGGASLTYASEDPAVIAAIHDWFAAQRADHGAHSHMHEHMQH